MSAAAILVAGQTGLSLLEAGINYDYAKDSLGKQAFAETFRGEMERFQLRRQATLDVQFRQSEYAAAAGATNAALAASGVVGGRTMRLLEARNRLSMIKAVREIQISEMLGLRSSEYTQAQNISALRTSAERFSSQTLLDLAGTAVSAGKQITNISSAASAKKGP